MHAEDDPLVNPEGVPVKEMVANPNVTVVWTRWGGHIGWGEGMLPSLNPIFAEKLAVEWLAARLHARARASTTAPLPTPAPRLTTKHGSHPTAALSNPVFVQSWEGVSNYPTLQSKL